MPKIQLKRVCGMVKNGAHTILKIKKRKVPQIFCFFSMVWGDLDVNVDIGCFGFFCLGVRHLEPQPTGLPHRVFKKTHRRHTFFSIKFRINLLLGFGIPLLSWVFRQLKAGFCRKIRLKSGRDRVGNRKSQNGIPKIEIRFQITRKSDIKRTSYPVGCLDSFCLGESNF